MRIYKLENTIQHYAWGSRDGLSKTLGIPNPSDEPAAELWMGAHPKAPSVAITPEGRRALDELIREEPEACLGGEVLARFGPALPFLFKVLSAARPLSVQAHPASYKAARGYEREELAGIPRDAPERNYRDPNHKPEQTVALTRFELLCGFKPIREILESIRILAPQEHSRYITRLERNPGRIELSVLFYSFISLDIEAKRRLLDRAGFRVAELLEQGELNRERREAFEWILRLLKLYPDDIGALTPVIFNHLVLEPGESIFISPGEPHTYLGGTALEIMANSDNVIRGALTEKHVDLPELVSVLSFNPGKPDIAKPALLTPGEETYPVLAPDFCLSRISVATPLERVAEGPEIILVTEGTVEIESEGSVIALGRSDSAFIRADAGTYTLRGPGIVYRAALPRLR